MIKKSVQIIIFIHFNFKIKLNPTFFVDDDEILFYLIHYYQ